MSVIGGNVFLQPCILKSKLCSVFLIVILYPPSYSTILYKMNNIITELARVSLQPVIYHHHRKNPYAINMMTSSNGNISALLALCAGNSPVTVEFPAQRPVTRSFGVFFDLRLNKRLSKQDLRLNKRLSKQSWGWWFETPSHSLWRHCNETVRTPKCNSNALMWDTYK